jgi:hypothetical protein
MYSDGTLASRRRQSLKVQNKVSEARNTTLPLPFELRDQILTFLLVSKQEILGIRQGQWPLYLPGRYYIRDRITTDDRGPRINDLKISKQFRILTQVCRQLRADAITILFYRNKWHLTISLSRDEYQIGRPVIFAWDSSAMVRKLWGLNAILSLQNVKITIENESKIAHKRVQGYLQTFVKLLTLSRSLKTLEVEWLNYENLEKEPLARGYPFWLVGSKRSRQKDHIREVSRKADGTRESTKHFRKGVSRWEDGQTILKPLEALCGIPEAVVTGCVTDGWAEHLEKCMKSERPAVSLLMKKK